MVTFLFLAYFFSWEKNQGEENTQNLAGNENSLSSKSHQQSLRSSYLDLRTVARTQKTHTVGSNISQFLE